MLTSGVKNEVATSGGASIVGQVIPPAIEHGGRYYLTYHRWADRKQVETCYPQFVEFLRLKKKYDLQERIQSDWSRHYKSMFAGKL